MKAASLTVTLALAVATGCAAVPRRGASGARDAGLAIPPARGDFTPGESERVLRSAVAVLREEGLRIASCASTRIETAPREFDVPCGSSRCLGRESLVVRIGHYRARVDLTRVVWNGGTRTWDPLLGIAGVEDAALHEQRILRSILDLPPETTAAVPSCAPEHRRVADAGETPAPSRLWADAAGW